MGYFSSKAIICNTSQSRAHVNPLVGGEHGYKYSNALANTISYNLSITDNPGARHIYVKKCFMACRYRLTHKYLSFENKTIGRF